MIGGLGLRVLVPIIALAIHGDFAAFRFIDSESYLAPARELLSGASFSTHGHVELIRTPGYPLLLVPGLLFGQTELITIALQVLLSGITILAVYGVAKNIFDKEAAFFALTLFAFEPLSIAYCSRLASETAFSCALALMIYCLTRGMRDGSIARVSLAAVFGAAGAYIRPIGLYLIPIIAILVIAYGIVTRVPKLAVTGGVLAGVFAACVVPWCVRNRALTGYSGFSAISDLNVYYYQAGALLAKRSGLPFYESQRRLGLHSEDRYLESHPGQERWSWPERYRYMRNAGFRVVADSWREYVPVHLRGLLMIAAEPGSIELSKILKLYPTDGGLLEATNDRGIPAAITRLWKYKFAFFAMVIFGLMLIAYWGFALIGARIGFKQAPLMTIVIVASIAYLLFAAAGPVSDSRFRHPAMPLICVLGGAGLSSTIARTKRRRLVLAAM